VTAAHRDGHYRRAHPNLLREGAAPNDQRAHARPARRPSPHAAERSAPAQRLPARPAGRSPLDGHRALLVKNAVSTVTIFAGAVASYLTAHLAFARLIGRQALTGLTLAHGYDTSFWWTAGIVAGALLRPGPMDQQGTPSQAHGKVPTAQATTGPARPA
jgi:hypothetical protein